MAVYKDKKRGTYYVSYSVKNPETGKFKHICKRGFASKREAKKWEVDSYDSNRITGNDISGVSFLTVAKQWEQACQCSLEVQKKHKAHFEKRFNDFQNRAIESISKADLIQWRSDLIDCEGATRTKNTTIAYVKSVFRFANDIYGIPNNAISLRNLKRSEKEVLQEMEVWTPEEFQRFLTVVDDRVYQLYFEFLFWTGCRRGEALALQKNDLVEQCAIIRYSKRRQRDGLKPTKTKTIRRVRLDNVLWNDIQELLDEPGPYLFGGELSLSPTAIRNKFLKAIDISGNKVIRIHDLRHSHATWLINNGVNIVAVSKRLGHAGIEQTLKTYTHLLESSDQNMMEKLNDSHVSSTI